MAQKVDCEIICALTFVVFVLNYSELRFATETFNVGNIFGGREYNPVYKASFAFYSFVLVLRRKKEFYHPFCIFSWGKLFDGCVVTVK
jgi:hypothetical protein